MSAVLLMLEISSLKNTSMGTGESDAERGLLLRVPVVMTSSRMPAPYPSVSCSAELPEVSWSSLSASASSATVSLSLPVPRHGVRTVDILGEPSRHRNLSACASAQALSDGYPLQIGAQYALPLRHRTLTKHAQACRTSDTPQILMNIMDFECAMIAATKI